MAAVCVAGRGQDWRERLGLGECFWGHRALALSRLRGHLLQIRAWFRFCPLSGLPSPGAHATLPLPPSRRSPQWSPLCQLAGSMGSSWTVQTIRPGSQWRNMAPGLTARRPRQHPGLELDRRQVATGGRAGQAPRAAPGGCSEDPGSLCLMAVPQGAPSPVQRGTAQQPSCLQRPRPGRASWHCP